MAPVRVPNSCIRTQRKSSVSTLAALASIKTSSSSSSSAAVTFAPNVTPVTYVEEQAEDFMPAALGDEEYSLFPPTESLLGDPSVKRSHASRKKGDDHIPRPPNAFMLFRANFVKQRHVPGSIDTSSGSLSKIIGTCWRNLPLNDKRVWEIKAKQAKLEHKHRYPNYRFRPVHSKTKKAGAVPPKAAPTALEEARVEGVARLLLEGKKGDELAREVRALDATFRDMAVQQREQQQLQAQQHYHEQQQAQLHAPVPSAWAPVPHPHRRSSSVPAAMHAPHIALPSLPFFQPASRPRSPGAPQHHMQAPPPRRPSSVPPFFHAPWLPADASGFHAFGDHAGLPLAADLDLPEADTSMFEPTFFHGAPFSFASPPAPLDLGFDAGLAPHELPTPVSAALPTPDQVAFGAFAQPTYSPAEYAPAYSWGAPAGSPTYSSSPAPSEPDALYAQTPYAAEYNFGGAYGYPSEPRVAAAAPSAPEFGNPFGGAEFAQGVFAAGEQVDTSKFNPRDFRMSTVDFQF